MNCKLKLSAPLVFFFLLLSCSMGFSQVEILIQHNGPQQQINANLLGTNLPTWVNRFNSSDSTFHRRTLHSGTTMVRIPGGSWSNSYDWSACENDQCGYGANEGWAIRPSDFINFLKETSQEAMFTLNANGTSKEAAALVAFFNGSVSDDKNIGVDVRGKDWGKVSDWAKLRSKHGNPEPFPITWWEFGNEIYGGKPGRGKDCLEWGWEEVWTCDGTEYIEGIGTGVNRHEGYLEFRQAMQAVDPTIKLGAIGVSVQDNWTNWGNEVIAAAGDVMDFYVVHQYAYFEPPSNRQITLSEPQTTWPTLTAGVHVAFATYAKGRQVPLAITEYNMFSSWDKDPDSWMLQAVNMLHSADTIGQMMKTGVAMANQWALSNGLSSNGTDYGLVHNETFEPYPHYYAYRLWSRFGTAMVPHQANIDTATTLSLYTGKDSQGNITLFAINKTEANVEASISLEGTAINQAWVDSVTAESLNARNVLYNGVLSPSIDFSNAPPTVITPTQGTLNYSFPKYSITLIQVKSTTTLPPPPPGSLRVISPSSLLLLKE